MTLNQVDRPHENSPSPFTGQRVHELLGLLIASSAPPPVFDDDRWDLSGIVDAPVQIAPCELVWDFTVIPNPHWRTVVREFVVALCAPHDHRVLALHWARRRPVSLRTCIAQRYIVVAWLRWLAQHGVDRLAEVTQETCDRYLNQRVDKGISSSSLTNEILALKDLARYNELYSADRFSPGFFPWGSKAASSVAGHAPAGENLTLPVPDVVLGPALHAALYLVDVVGPHLETAAAALTRRRAIHLSPRHPQQDEVARLLDRYHQQQRPLPELDLHEVRDRIASGWRPDDPLLRLNFGELARDLGVRQFDKTAVRRARDLAENAVARLGIEPFWCRYAAEVDSADGATRVPWTRPLFANQLGDLTRVVVNAALFVTAAVTGMRPSELMELAADSCVPPRELRPGLFRYALASKRIKGEEWGGAADEWVVIEPAYRAVGLATRLAAAMAPPQHTDADTPTGSLFGRYSMVQRFQTFRQWVNGPAGQCLGLEPIPNLRLTGRMLRRTLALELTHRPHGLWAAKVHLKHISVTTTEGYSKAPGGSQARFHAEMAAAEREHALERTVDAYRDYREGRLPSGPGAADLIAAFQHVDAELGKPTQPTVVATDRHIELLLKKRAGILHIQPANYCWFTEPAKALCLKLAGDSTATKPLAGLCDAARCPQATFHTQHRDAWSGRAESTATFLGNPRIPAAEKPRLAREHERAQEVLAAIDAASANEEHPHGDH